MIRLSFLQIFQTQQWQQQWLTSQISHSRSQAHSGRQCAVVWWSSAEQDVIWQGLVYHWASGAGIGGSPSVATYAFIREGAVKCPPRGKVSIEGKLSIKIRAHIAGWSDSYDHIPSAALGSAFLDRHSGILELIQKIRDFFHPIRSTGASKVTELDIQTSSQCFGTYHHELIRYCAVLLIMKC